MLALLPAERPLAFDRLPFEEQQWRGRCFLMIYSGTGNLAYAWFTALKEEEDDATAKAIVEATPDNEIVSALLGLQAAQSTEAQQAQGGPA